MVSSTTPPSFWGEGEGEGPAAPVRVLCSSQMLDVLSDLGRCLRNALAPSHAVQSLPSGWSSKSSLATGAAPVAVLGALDRGL